jgi:nucleoside phosphorylase
VLILIPTAFELQALFPEAGTLRAHETWRLGARPGHEVARCGLGLASAGAHAAALLAEHDADAVLVGLAGSHDLRELPLGAAFLASTVDVDGIGFGEGADFLAPAASERLGEEWESMPPADPWLPDGLDLPRHGLLSVAAASATRAVAARRRSLFPRAVAEDMEAHAVLLAAAATGRRLAVLRAASNEVGDRDPARWAVAEAARALRAVLDTWLSG